MTQEGIDKVAREYAEAMAKLFPELKEKRKYRNQISKAKNVIGLLLRNYNITIKNNALKHGVIINAWISRDRMGCLSIHNEEPDLIKKSEWVSRSRIGLNLDDFPSVTFEKSPKRIKITIELEE